VGDRPDAVRLEAVGRLTTAQVAAVSALVDDATDLDGVRALSEHVLLHLRYGGDQPARNVLVWEGRPERLVAYAHLDVTDQLAGPSAELVVSPAARRHGFGRALVDHLLAHTGGRLRLWAHGDLPEAALMAHRLGFQKVRVLWQMRRSLSVPLPRIGPPEAVTIRTFVPGADDAAWLALNARAFAAHPEQGSWTIEDLHQRTGERWFDPAGFFLAERDHRLIGFHWTKVHGDEMHGHEPIGEVYVVGVDPAAHGQGLGRLLTVVGLRHLRARGLLDAMLYVDESNVTAIKLYESLGFSRFDTDTLFLRG
jgi:mycothiol synthase